MDDLFEGLGDDLGSMGEDIGSMGDEGANIDTDINVEDIGGGGGFNFGAGSETKWTFAPDWQPSSAVPEMFRNFTSNLPKDMLPGVFNSTSQSLQQMSNPQQMLGDATRGMEKSGPAGPNMAPMGPGEMANAGRPTLMAPGQAPQMSPQGMGQRPPQMPLQGGMGQAPTMGIPAGGIMPKMPAMMGPGGRQMPMPQPPMLSPGAGAPPQVGQALAGQQQPVSISHLKAGDFVQPTGERGLPSGANFASLNPAAQVPVRNVLSSLQQKGWDPIVRNGARSPEQAAANAASGAGVRNSRHIGGYAADIVPRQYSNPEMYNKAPAQFWKDLRSAAKENGMRSGMDFRNQDRPHVDMNPQMARQQSNPSLMSRVGNALMPQQAQAMPSVPQSSLQPGGNIRGALQQEAQAAGNIPKGAEQYQGMFSNVGKQLGVNPQYFNKLGVESANTWKSNLTSHTGAKGLFQFTNKTWREMTTKYPEAFKGVNVDRMDPRANTIATALYAKENAQGLQKMLGRAPTNAEVYMAHNVGLGGARSLLRADPNVQVSKVLDRGVYGPNPKFFSGGRVTVGEALRRYRKDIGTEAFF